MASSPKNGGPRVAAEFRFDLSGAPARTRREQCERSLTELSEEPTEERIRLLAHLVAAMAESEPEEAAGIAAQIQALATTVGTDVAEAYALTVRGLTDHSPDTGGIRVTGARRILAIAHRGSTPELAAVGHFLLLTALVEQGLLRTLDIELSPYGESITRFPQLENAQHTAWFRCLRAILDGRTVEAERMADEILAAADEEGAPSSRSIWSAQIGTIRWMQGRIFEMEPAFLAARQEYPHQQLWEISLAWLWHLQGRDDAAHALFMSFTDMDRIPRDRNYLVTVTILAELASKIGTPARMLMLRDALLPYVTQAVPVGFGVAFWGTVARTTGMLALRLGKIDEARALFSTAVDVCARNGAQAWMAESQLELADLELASGNIPLAASLARQAEATSRALGFPALRARARALVDQLPEPSNTVVGTHLFLRNEVPRAEVRVLGAFDVVSHGGARAQWTSRKARELLKMLVARRGTATSREIFMHELWPDVHPDDLANRFSVALSTVRRALDPKRVLPSQHFVVTAGQSLHLDTTALRVDVEEFLEAARNDDIDSLRSAVRLYTGDAFAEDPYSDWAQSLRHEAQTVFCVTARTLAAHDLATGDALSASELFRRILEIEPFDDAASEGLVDALRSLGAEAQAESVRLRQELLRRELSS